MVVMKERSIIVQFSLVGLLYLILPLLLQFCNTLKATWEKKPWTQRKTQGYFKGLLVLFCLPKWTTTHLQLAFHGINFFKGLCHNLTEEVILLGVVLTVLIVDQRLKGVHQAEMFDDAWHYNFLHNIWSDHLPCKNTKKQLLQWHHTWISVLWRQHDLTWGLAGIVVAPFLTPLSICPWCLVGVECEANQSMSLA